MSRTHPTRTANYDPDLYTTSRPAWDRTVELLAAGPTPRRTLAEQTSAAAPSLVAATIDNMIRDAAHFGLVEKIFTGRNAWTRAQLTELGRRWLNTNP